MAVSFGHLLYQATWDVSGTEIIIGLSGDNYDVKLVIDYSATDPIYVELKKRVIEKSKANVL